MADPFTVIGVVATAAQLITTVIQVYNFIQDAQGLKTDAPLLYWKLRIEKIRLVSWGRYWARGAGGFDEFLIEAGLHGDVCGILQQMKDLLTDSDRLSSKYGVVRPEIIQALANSTNVVTTQQHSKPKHKHSVTAKFQWAFNDKAKFKALLADLKDFNDGLYSLLRLSEYSAVDLDSQSQALRVSDRITSVQHIKNVCLEQEESGALKVSRIANSNHQLLLGVENKILRLEQNQQVFAPAGIVVAQLRKYSMLKPASQVSEYLKTSPSSIRTLAAYRDETPDAVASSVPVMLEWKDFQPTNPHLRLIADRVESLARLLGPECGKPFDFHVLDCLGYFEDSERHRYGFLFALPSAAQPILPLTLQDLLSRASPGILPPLNERFRMAESIARSVVRLHDCGWVHAALRSSNVLFFHRQKGNQSPSSHSLILNHPYITGFTYSRPSDPTESTLEYSQLLDSSDHDLYRHPAIQRSNMARYDRSNRMKHVRYQQRHDLFSLGVILLKIGLWEQIVQLWKKKYTPEAFLQKLLDVYVPALGHKVGTVYQDIVSELLVGDESSIAAKEIGQAPDSADTGAIEEQDFKEEEIMQLNLGDENISTSDEDVESITSPWASVIARLADCRA
ncbi:hypothetical protein MMC26_001412 [Xylographa opegraphella]|nr:hypothetical protein [Xylographa opegraphella]